MDIETIKQQTYGLIDRLKKTTVDNGLAGGGNEYTVIIETFLYKFLNDKFIYDFKHEHAHVLGNLLGGGCPKLAEIVENPLTTDQVMYAGLKTQDLENYEKKHMEHYKLKYATPDSLKKDSSEVICWILENGFKKIVIHWDLDVLSPIDFRSLLCNEPHMPPVEYAVGDMYLDEIGRLINDISKAADIVGLGITEYMPWDAIRLNRTLSSIDIFKD